MASHNLNIPFIINKYAQTFIVKTNNTDDVIRINEIYWAFTGFVYRNIISPHNLDYRKIKTRLQKDYIIKLFQDIVFKNKPIRIKRGEDYYKTFGWRGWMLLDIGIEPHSRRKKLNHEKYFKTFNKLFLLKAPSKRYRVRREDIWTIFRGWWKRITKRKPPHKENFFQWIEDNYFLEPPIITKNFIGWRGYKLFI